MGLAEGGTLTHHKVGTRYVQSRTAAGGWSQQRFARRRANQADDLVRAVAGQVVRLVPVRRAAGLVVGGDRRLVADVLSDPRLEPLRDLPRRELTNLPDPRLRVLEDVIGRARAVWIDVEDLTRSG